MCGLVGFFSPSVDFSKIDFHQVIDTLSHRGPDDSGLWQDKKFGVALGHRRLSILDLSKAGHQPMVSSSGRFVIVFNGEIYNHLKMRSQLNRNKWKGHSDTETLLGGFEEWGIKRTLEKSKGMFAMAIWDKKQKVLQLARDRMGEKPLYYGWLGDNFVFASELGSIKGMNGFDKSLNNKVLPFYLRHGYIPSPYSIYKNVFKVEAGTLSSINIKTHKNHKIKSDKYWSFESIVKRKKTPNNFKKKNKKFYTNKLDLLLRDSVKKQMLSDVPVGAFLSGGIDSSLIVAIMQSLRSEPVRTFTIGFDVKEFDEAHHAKKIANYLGTNHTELYVKAQDALDVIPKLNDIYNEPFADDSAIPTYLVSKLAKNDVQVSLSGDAGDELFCGYPRYKKAVGHWSKLRYIPCWLRLLMVKSGFARKIVGSKHATLEEALLAKNMVSFYYAMTSSISTSSLLVDESNHNLNFADKVNSGQFRNEYEKLMYIDSNFYLPDDILVKVDRAAMANSLETRIPLLDPAIISFAWNIPFEMKLNKGKNKWILRQLLKKYLPKNLFERPKSGFGVPINRWLKTDLHEWAQDLLSPSKLKKQNIFNVEKVRGLLQEHLNGSFDRSGQLWKVLVFQDWLENNN